ncbi:MAG: sulfur carrier protein ThiS [Bacteroidales bacterium]|jgi:thiamine biosynthesis protein ThiS|nr:sulfur carrier protein ThiS [Bacteroidales bacterium]
MNFLLNNREEVIDADNLTVSMMLELKKFSFRMRIIRINGVFIPKEQYDTTFIREGDNVMMLYLMSGG